MVPDWLFSPQPGKEGNFLLPVNVKSRGGSASLSQGRTEEPPHLLALPLRGCWGGEPPCLHHSSLITARLSHSGHSCGCRANSRADSPGRLEAGFFVLFCFGGVSLLFLPFKPLHCWHSPSHWPTSGLQLSPWGLNQHLQSTGIIMRSFYIWKNEKKTKKQNLFYFSTISATR